MDIKNADKALSLPKTTYSQMGPWIVLGIKKHQ